MYNLTTWLDSSNSRQSNLLHFLISQNFTRSVLGSAAETLVNPFSRSSTAYSNSSLALGGSFNNYSYAKIPFNLKTPK